MKMITNTSTYLAMHRSLIFALVLTSGHALAATTASHPADRWELALQTGYTANIGHNTPLDYEIIPTQLVLRGPTMFEFWSGENGARFLLRNRFALLAESVIKGPESYYLGLNAAPSLEYWFPSGKTSVYFSIGGGIGLTDSTHVPGGQGQDFTLNWFSELGIRQEIAKDLSIIGGVYFLHHSNGGQTDPNPGIDALGVTLGLGWQF
jgi:lipid A 3-O-deacylase